MWLPILINLGLVVTFVFTVFSSDKFGVAYYPWSCLINLKVMLFDLVWYSTVVELLGNMCEDLDSTPDTAKKERNRTFKNKRAVTTPLTRPGVSQWASSPSVTSINLTNKVWKQKDSICLLYSNALVHDCFCSQTVPFPNRSTGQNFASVGELCAGWQTWQRPSSLL